MVRLCGVLNHGLDTGALLRGDNGGDDDGDVDEVETTADASAADTSDGVAEKKHTRCVMCKGAGSKRRAFGRCRVCRVALCQACSTIFHVRDFVTEEGARKGKRAKRVLDFVQ